MAAELAAGESEGGWNCQTLARLYSLYPFRVGQKGRLVFSGAFWTRDKEEAKALLDSRPSGALLFLALSGNGRGSSFVAVVDSCDLDHAAHPPQVAHDPL